MDHTKHIRLAEAELTPEILDGATVYGPFDEEIGSVDHVHGTGSSARVAIDVGGLLGFSSQRIAVAANDLDFMRGDDRDVHALTGWLKDEMKAMPEHTEAASLGRPSGRLIVSIAAPDCVAGRLESWT